MSSFYGNGGISISSKDIEEIKNHIIFSKTQPTVQKAGDIWVVIISDDQEQENNNNNNNNNDNG